MYIRKVFLLLLLCILGWNLSGQPLFLVKEGKAVSAIILGEKPTRSARFGALELQHFIRQITGASLPVRKHPLPGDKNQIIVGYNEYARKAGIQPFTGEEYGIFHKENILVLAGNDDPDYGEVNYGNVNTFPAIRFCYRSTTYAVYDFLEKNCSVNFYTYGEDGVTYPRKKSLAVSGKSYRRTPTMPGMRYPHIEGRLKQLKVPEREARLLLLRWRVNVMYGLTNHSIYSIYPRYWDKTTFKKLSHLFIEKRKEYFAQRKPSSIKNKSAVYRWFSSENPPPSQLCYSHPGVLEYFANEALLVSQGKKVEASYALIPRMKDQPFFYPFQEDDDHYFCECDKCSARLKKKPYAYWHFDFVNKLAKAVSARSKDTGISTLAYSQSLERPRDLKLAKNIAVQMCLSIQSWYHPQVYKRQHGAYQDWVRAEGKNRPLFLWLYLLNPGHEARRIYKYNEFFPVLYPRNAAGYAKEFSSDKIHGFFAEIDYALHPLETYLLTKLAYDGSLDTEKLIGDYFRNYYGKSGKEMKAFYDTLEKYVWNIKNYAPEVQKMEKKGSFVYGLHPERYNWYLGKRSMVEKLDSLVKAADRKAASPEEKSRMKRFRDQIWDQAVRGRKAFEVREKARSVAYPELTVRFLREKVSDPRKIDFSNAQTIRSWYCLENKPSAIKAQCSMAYDQNALYIRYREDDSYAYKNRSQSFWLNGMEIFLSTERKSDYIQIAVGPMGQCEVYERVTIAGVQKLRRKKIEAKLYPELTPDSWEWILVLPLQNLFDGKKILQDSRIFGNLCRTRRCGKWESFTWSPIFSESYQESLYRMSPIFFQKEPGKGRLPIGFHGKKSTLAENWFLVKDKGDPEGRILSFDGKTQHIHNGKNRVYWRNIFWKSQTPCQAGDTLTMTFTAWGKGPVYCGAYLYSWHRNWAGSISETRYMTPEPKKYSVTLRISPEGKKFKRYPMESRVFFAVQGQMYIKDLQVEQNSR